MKKLYITAAIVCCMTVGLSILPFMQPEGKWTGYGSMGSHFYKNMEYEIHYGEASTGIGKPQIYLIIQYDKTPLIEFSDQRSELNGLKIHDNFSETIKFEGDSLIATYGESILVKKVTPKKDGVIISYYSNCRINLTLTLWRWYYDSIENLTKYSPSGSKLRPSNKINYTFKYVNEKFVSGIEFNELPEEILVYNDGVGLNKILVSFRQTENITITIKVLEKPYQINTLTLTSKVVYPLIATITSVAYFIILAFTSKFKIEYPPYKISFWLKPAYVAIISFSIRIVLAPFFMHIWDVVTIHEALNDFICGKNVYSSVIEKTIILRQSNGVEANYEGYAYFPHILIIYTPFYLIYSLICNGNHAIVDGHFKAPKLIEPNIYIFLTLIKFPIVLADTIITYIIAKRSTRLGLFYALLPYSITITSIWGNFDSLIGLLLLLAFLTLKEKPTLSGIFYGTSLMKLFVAITFPAFLISLPRKKDHYLKFLTGVIISQIPTLVFLIQDTSSMINVLLFHSTRSPGGVNIYHLAPKLYSYQLQSLLNKISIVILAITISIILLKTKPIEEKIALSLAAYMVLGPVVNEQHLATLIPILILLNYYNLTLILSTGYLVYALFYSGPTYFMTPLAKLLGDNTIISDIGLSWTILFNQITPQLLYTISVACSLVILYNIIRKCVS